MQRKKPESSPRITECEETFSGRWDERAEYNDIMRDLHDDCFYSGIIIKKNIEKAAQKAEEFLKRIEEAEKS